MSSADSKRLFLRAYQVGDAALREAEQRVELGARERLALGGALHLDEAAVAGHDHVHVAVALRILCVVEVEHRRAVEHADGNGGDMIPDGILSNEFLALEPCDGVMQGNKRSGDGRSARAAVGLQHVAVQIYGSRPERGAVNDGAERASYQALDLLRAPGLLAARRLAVGARVGGARQHAVFRRYPAATRILEESRHALLDARGAQHARLAELDQHRTLGVLGEAALDAHRAQLVGFPAGRPGRGLHCGAFLRNALFSSLIAFSTSSSVMRM